MQVIIFKYNLLYTCGTTVKALIKVPLKNNYDPQSRLVRSEKITSDP